jgi:glycosyltransferase involved in cell wall biosynthesis
MTVSLCMIVKNEEENIAECLDSVADIVDEIIVADTGSADATDEIAERFGAKVYAAPWNDSFSEARNFSLSKASGDWILIMDADDRLEPADREALRELAERAPADTDIFCCRTLCYSGETPDLCGALVNWNIRLIRNGRGYRYTGRIHEQLRPAPECAGTGRVCAAEVRFSHYGYLRREMEKKEKHRRNIALLEKELADAPDSAFYRFNLGNEYLAQGNAEKAMEFYRLSFRNFDPGGSFGPMLFTRAVVCCDRLRRFSELEHTVALGLRCYPDHTDLEFLRAGSLQRRKKWAAAIRSYRKCIRMGESERGGLAGVGTFRPHLELACLYARLGDTDSALRHCRKALRLYPLYRDALGLMADLLLQRGTEPQKLKTALIRLSGRSAESFRMLSDIFYDRRCYREALQLARFLEKQGTALAEAAYRQGVCLFSLGKYRPALVCFQKVKGGELSSRSAFFRSLCRYFLHRDAFGTLSEADGPFQMVLEDFFRLLSDGETVPLEKENRSPEYREALYGLLKVLLQAGCCREFHVALELIGRLEDPDAFLRLGKLYYRSGCAKLAYCELAKSIRLTGRMDEEGLTMMKNTISEFR